MNDDPAYRVAFDTEITDQELAACRDYVAIKIADARAVGAPAPFLEYRSLQVFKAAIRIHRGSASAFRR